MRLLSLFLLILSLHVYAEFVGTTLKIAKPTLQYGFQSEDKKLQFEPNPQTELSVLFLGPSYAFGIQFSGEDEEDRDYLESSYSDFKISYYTPQFLVDLFYMDFVDFYHQNDLDLQTEANPETISGSSLGAQVLFMDQENIFEFHGDYVFSPKTTFDTYIKLRFAYNEFSGNDTIIPGRYSSDFSEISDIKKVTSTEFESQIGLSGLYAFEHIFFNSYLSLGPVLESQQSEGDENNQLTLITGVAEGFLGAAFYTGSLQVGLRAQGRHRVSQLNGIEMSQSYASQYVYLLVFF